MSVEERRRETRVMLLPEEKGRRVVVETPLGTFTIGPVELDYSDRDTIEVELEAAPGCTTTMNAITREHVYEPVPLPRPGELRNYFAAVARFLRSDQPGRRYASHFGVSGPDLGRFRVEVTPDRLTVNVREPLSPVRSGPILNPITEEERTAIVQAVGYALKVEESWHGAAFVSIRYQPVSPESHLAAFSAYEGLRPRTGGRLPLVEVPAGWSS